MEVSKIKIEGIPALLWGAPSDRWILAAHGSHSSKIDDCIWILAEEAVKKGYRVLSFDLPQHGERVYETDRLLPDNCARELQRLYAAIRQQAGSVSLFGCSMGAYFQLLAFGEAEIDTAWFLSPVTDMLPVIQNLMAYCQVTEQELRERVLVENGIEPLYYPYYEFVKEHPITRWGHKTHILRGEGDTLCAYAAAREFAERFGCELCVQLGGEHWFHTESQLAFFRDWIAERL